MTPNLLVLLACSFIPMILGMIWYHPKVFGTSWQQAVGLSDEQFSQSPKWYHMVLSLFLNFLLAFGIFAFTIHQFHLLGLAGGDSELLKQGTAAAFINEYGNNFLTLGHGIAHGITAFLVFALPFIAGPAIWEKKGMKYVLINGSYWLITIVTMASIISLWGWVPIA